VPPILVANEQRTMNMLQKLLKLLGLAEDAKDEQIETVANSVVARATIYDKLLALVGLTDAEKRKAQAAEIANAHKDDGLVTHLIGLELSEATAVASVATLTAERDAANTRLLAVEKQAEKLPTVEGELTLANGKVSTLETTFANERKHRIELLIANGMREGKISAATKGQWEQDFANSFEATLTKFDTAPKIVKTHSDVSRHAEKHAGIRSAQDRAEHVRELAQVHIANGMTPADAYARVYREDPTLAQVTA
jgi:carboxylesterase type B